MNQVQLEATANEILAGCTTMTLATYGPDGPWASDVFFASDGLVEHYFISNPSSRHGRNLGADMACAASVHPDVGLNWRAIRGLQMEGEGTELSEADAITRANAIYVAKFPFAAALLAPNSEIAGKTAGTRMFVLRPRRLHLVDNRAGFGNRQEIELPLR